MFCRHCGTGIPEDSTFCLSCGKPVQAIRQKPSNKPSIDKPLSSDSPQAPSSGSSEPKQPASVMEDLSGQILTSPPPQSPSRAATRAKVEHRRAHFSRYLLLGILLAFAVAALSGFSTSFIIDPRDLRSGDVPGWLFLYLLSFTTLLLGLFFIVIGYWMRRSRPPLGIDLLGFGCGLFAASILFAASRVSSYRDTLGNHLLFAAGRGDEGAVAKLIDYGAPVNFSLEVADARLSPFHVAIACNHFRVAELLLRRGRTVGPMSPDITYVIENYLLARPMYAFCNPRGPEVRPEQITTLVTLLAERGANINSKMTVNSSALDFAVVNDHVGLADMLIKHGANINQKSKEGTSMLLRAVRKNNPEMVAVLVAAGADLKETDRFGESLLEVAKSNCQRCIPLLRERVFTR
jgi:ankyrin repeat protein